MPEVVAEALVALRPHMDEGETRRRIAAAVDSSAQRPVNVPLGVDRPGFLKQMDSLRGAVAGTALFAGLATGKRIVDDLAESASDLDEAMNAATVQFGTASDEIIKWASTTRTALGISKAEALENAAAFGGMFEQLELGDEATATLSKGMVQLAGDLASLRNLRVDDALVKIQSGLAGETEPLRRYGVNLTEVAVRAKAVELNLAEVGEELTEQEKVLARSAIIMEALSEAHGDSERTADSYANAQRRANATLEDLKAALGVEVGSALADFASNMAFLADKASDLEGRLGTIPGAAQKAFEFATLGFAVRSFGMLNDSVGALRKFFGDADNSAQTYGETMEAVTAAVEALNERNLENVETLELQAQAGIDAADAALALRDAELGVSDAEEKVTDAERDLADARRGTGRYAEEATRAAEKLEDAHQSLARSQQRVKELTWDLSDAQEAYADAVFRFGPGSREARDASRELESANDDLANAQLDAKDAADDLAKAQEDAAAKADRTKAIEDAQRKLERSNIDLEAAVGRAAKAQDAYADKTAEATGKTYDDVTALETQRDALKRYSDTLDGPVKTAVQGRIDQLDVMIAKLKEANALLPAAEGGGMLSSLVGVGADIVGNVSGAGLGGALADIGSNIVGGTTEVHFHYPVPADQVAAYVESATRTAR